MQDLIWEAIGHLTTLESDMAGDSRPGQVTQLLSQYCMVTPQHNYHALIPINFT